MQHRATLPGQLTEQREGDDALAGPRSALDDHHLLGDALSRLLHGTQHEAVRHLLLAQQPELRSVADLARGDGEQLPARPHGGAEQQVRRGGPPVGGQALLHVTQELGAALPGEQAPPLVLGQCVQVGDALVRRVVQVGHSGEGVVEVRQSRGEVRQVPAVATNLLARVQALPTRARHQADVRGAGQHLRPAPLLELDDDVGRRPGLRVHPAEHGVGALARQGELVLDQDLDLVQTGLHEVGGQDVQAAFPRQHLAGRRRAHEPVPVLLGQDRHQGTVQRSRAQVRDRGAEQSHEHPEQRQAIPPCGWGLVGWC